MFKKLNKDLCTKCGLALTIVIVTVAVIWGAWRTNEDKVIPIDNPVEIYAEAATRLSSAENVYYKVSGSRKITVNESTIEESYTQLITFEAQNTENFRGCVEENLQIGTHDIKSFEFYSDNVAYFTTQSASFQSSMSAEEYIGRYTPAAPIDPSLYADITGFQKAKINTITFAKPGAVETWINENGISVKEASASAVINPDGDLKSSTYTVTYAQQDATVTLEVTVEIMYNKIPPIELPNSSVYTTISDIDAPKTLELACGYLTGAQRIHSVYTDTIYCEAFGDERTQTIHLDTNSLNGWSANVKTHVSVSNSSKAGVIAASSKNELFESGIYSYAIDGSELISDNNVDEATMRGYCENLLIGTILLPEYITSVEITETEDTISFAFKPSEDFANVLAQDACLALYQNATILIEQALSSETKDVSCYINIDEASGFPTSSGFYYSGTYVIGGIPYELSFKADQTYTYAPENIEEEHTDPSEETEAQETPAS